MAVEVAPVVPRAQPSEARAGRHIAPGGANFRCSAGSDPGRCDRNNSPASPRRPENDGNLGLGVRRSRPAWAGVTFPMFRRFRSHMTLREQPHHRPAGGGRETGSRWPKPRRWGPVKTAIGTSRSGSRGTPAAPSSLGNIRTWRARMAAHSPFPLFARSTAPPMPAHHHATVTPRHCAHIPLNRAQPPSALPPPQNAIGWGR
jgi:hypothetical protein